MGAHPATVPCSLRCGAAVAAVRRSTWPRSAGFLVRDGGRSNGTGVKLSCVGPTSWSYPHNFDSDSEPMPPGRWLGEALLEEDAEFFPLADFIPVGQGRKEMDAIWHALVAGPLESVQLTLREIVAAGNLFRCRSFHVGSLSGALLVVAGFCQLCKTTPTLFVDIVLGSVFYKLSVLSGQLQREGKSFSICARIQLVLLLILSFKDKGASQVAQHLRDLIMAYDATVGGKHGRFEWLGVYRLLRTKGGLMKVLKHTFLDIFGGNKKPVSIKRRNRKGQ